MPEEKNNEVNGGGVKMESYTPVPPVQSHHAHLGPILGVIVIVLVLIFVGLNLWGGLLSKEIETVIPEPIVNNEPETPRAVADTQILGTLSPSDDLSAIEADVSSTNFDSLETDITAIDVEFNTELEVQ